MREYTIRRILLMVPTMFIVTLFTFLTIRFIPGDVVELMVMHHMREQSSSLSAETPLDVDAVRRMLGLDVPWYTQYGRWVKGVFTKLDFGKSLWTGRPVLEAFAQRLPITFELGALAFIISQIIAFPIGIYAAIRQNSIGDFLGRSFAIVQLAMPNFWIGTMIMVFPSIWWGWSPPMQVTRFADDPLGHLAQFGIPALLIGWDMSATTMRMLRATLLDVLRQDYVRTAWSKGLRERVVVVRHAMRNAMMPIITIVGGQIPIMWGGVVIMETIFQIPGMGSLFTDSVFRRDYPYTYGGMIIFATVGLFLTLSQDMSYALLDPRVRAKAFK